MPLKIPLIFFVEFDDPSRSCIGVDAVFLPAFFYFYAFFLASFCTSVNDK